MNVPTVVTEVEEALQDFPAYVVHDDGSFVIYPLPAARPYP